MPFFEVVKGQDAYVEYSRVIEADTAEAAFGLACTHEYRNGEDWIANGIIDEFDHADVFEDRTEEIEAETFEEAVKQIHEAYDFVDLRLEQAERDMILAALRLWNDAMNDGGHLINDGLLDIATNGGKHALMDDNAISGLCERINF